MLLCTLFQRNALYFNAQYFISMQYTVFYCSVLSMQYTVFYCPVLHFNLIHCMLLLCTLFNAIHCILLLFTLIQCNTRYFTALYFISMQYTVFYCSVLYFNAIHCILLLCTLFQCNTLYLTDLYFISLQCTAFYDTEPPSCHKKRYSSRSQSGPPG